MELKAWTQLKPERLTQCQDSVKGTGPCNVLLESSGNMLQSGHFVTVPRLYNMPAR